jgi:hypothetical protein
VSDARLTDVEVLLKHETKAAYLINDGTQDIWVPKSQCEIAENPTTATHTLTLPEWLAKEKGLI